MTTAPTVSTMHGGRGLLRQTVDLGMRGLYEAWDTGDWSPFHGWNRRAAAGPDPGPGRIRQGGFR